MSNPQKSKGDRWERDIIRWAGLMWGLSWHRLRAGQMADAGDLGGEGLDGLWHVDAKHQTRWRIPEWFAELEDEAAEADVNPMLIVRRAGRPDAGDALVVIRLRDAFDLIDPGEPA